MNRIHKAYIKINIISLFFIAISSISVTLAWFAYSGLAKVSTEKRFCSIESQIDKA